ncbi:MAG TPA: SUF system Fe-S cluster assembly protein [Gemmataceae bacterium]|jgi:FeS assembly SUF system protein|nr:SUF system Fe-S cluster assembly protein [Gemmataceae bacterium]
MNEQPVQIETDRLNPQREESTSPTSSSEAPAAQPATPPNEAESLSLDRIQEIENKIVEALHTCFDPEIPVNIYELGLIYNIDVQPTGIVNVRMTLTSPACPAAGSLPPEVRWKVQEIPGVKDAKVEIVWDPPWTKERMSEAARLQLGIFD